MSKRLTDVFVELIDVEGATVSTRDLMLNFAKEFDIPEVKAKPMVDFFLASIEAYLLMGKTVKLLHIGSISHASTPNAPTRLRIRSSVQWRKDRYKLMEAGIDSSTKLDFPGFIKIIGSLEDGGDDE